jgi:hypothetical protein
MIAAPAQAEMGRPARARLLTGGNHQAFRPACPEPSLRSRGRQTRSARSWLDRASWPTPTWQARSMPRWYGQPTGPGGNGRSRAEAKESPDGSPPYVRHITRCPLARTQSGRRKQQQCSSSSVAEPSSRSAAATSPSNEVANKDSPEHPVDDGVSNTNTQVNTMIKPSRSR